MVPLNQNRWLNDSVWKQKWFFNGITVKNLLSTFIFKSVQIQHVTLILFILHLTNGIFINFTCETIFLAVLVD